MQRNALGSICFLAFLLCGVSCKNVLKPYSGNQAFKRSLRVRFTRALEGEAVPDEHLVEELLGPLDNSKTDVNRRHISGQGDSQSESQANALAYAQLSGLGNEQANAQAFAESSAQENAGPQYQYGSIESPNQMPVLSDFLVYPGHSGSNVGLKQYGLGNELGSSQANAQANALSNGQASELGSAEANAQSNAQANLQSNGLGNYGSKHQYGSLDSSNNHYLVHPIQSGSNVGLRPYGSGYGPENSQANAQANAVGLGNAQANSESSALVNSGSQYLYDSLLSSDQLPNYLVSPSQSGPNVALRPDGSGYGLGNSQANAQANALSNGLGQGNAQANALSSGLGAAQAHSEASAQASYEGHSLGSWARQSREPDSEGLENQELSQDGVSSKSGAEYEVVNPFAGGYSRPIPRNRYILPHLLPGGRDFLQCSAEGEMHTAWTPQHECMVCACLLEGRYLVPHCVSCNTCQNPNPVVPAPVKPLPPLPPPESQVSCDPLPTDTPFQNPVNPCQMCVCSRVLNDFGRPDIQVVCQENPQCQPQPEILPVPIPIPDPVPVPEPQPEPEICAGLPVNVPFRHPADACKICVCAVEVSYGVPRQEVLCQPDPECEVEPIIIPEPVEPLPSPYPVPEPFPVGPEPFPVGPEPFPVGPEPFPVGPEPFPVGPEPFPVGPEPFHVGPESFPVGPEPFPVGPEPFPVGPDPFPVEPEPLPWPPAPVPGPLPPSPLPGPSPHQSCSPYPPNQPFQHPWDQCRVCVCYEVISANIINVEVDCFTSKLCCVDMIYPDQPNQLPALPGPNVQPIAAPQVQITYIDKKCQYRGLEVEFVNPSDGCSVCQCRQHGSLVLPSCKRLPRPECVASPVPSHKIDVVYIEPRCRTQLPHQQFSVRDYVCLCEPVYHYVIAKCVKRLPNIVSPFSPGSIILPPYNNGQSPQYPFIAPSNLNSGATSAQAHAFAESNVNSLNEEYLGNKHLYLPSNVQPYRPPHHIHSPGLTEALAHAQASGQGNALANAEAISQGDGQANAEAEANINSYLFNNKYPYHLNENNPLVRPSSNLNHGSLGDSVYQNSALAQANALANAQGYGQANAEAEASANSYYGGLKDVYNPYYLGGNKQLHIPRPNLNHGSLGDSAYQNSALAEANALANAQGYGQANAEAEANVNSYSNGLQGVYSPHYLGGNNPLLLPSSNLNIGSFGDSEYQNNALSQANALANAQGYGQANAEAEASANLYNGGLKDVYNPYYLDGNNPLILPSPYLNHGSLGDSGYQSSAQANAQANAQGYGQANAEAEASANSYYSGLKDVYNPYYLGGNKPLHIPRPNLNHGSLGDSAYQNSAFAEANALANAQGYGQANAEAEANVNSYSNDLQGVYSPHYLGGNNPLSLPNSNLNGGLLLDSGYLNNAQSNAEAYAQANTQGYGQANAEADASANSYYGGLKDIYNPYYLGGKNPLLLPSSNLNGGLLQDSGYLNNAQSSAEAYAQANAQGYGQANAEADANVNSYSNGLQGVHNPYYFGENNPLLLPSSNLNGGLLQDSGYLNNAQSSAEAYAQANAQGYVQANAEAEANVNSYSNGLQGVHNPYYFGENNPLLLPSSNLNGGLLQDSGYLNNAQSSAEAHAQANSQGNAIASAQANSQGNGLANALADASVNSHLSGLQDMYRPVYYRDKSSSAEAHSESSAEHSYGLVGAQSNQQSSAHADAYSENSAQKLGKGNLYTMYPQGNTPLNGRLNLGPLQLSAPNLYYVDKSGKPDDYEDEVSSAAESQASVGVHGELVLPNLLTPYSVSLPQLSGTSNDGSKSLAARSYSLDQASSDLLGLSLQDAKDVESSENLNSPQAQALSSMRGSQEESASSLESEEARR